MLLPSRLRTVDHQVKSGRFHAALRELTAVYDATDPTDRLLMAGIRFHRGDWRDAESLAQGLAGGRGVPLDVQGRAFELLTWLIKHKHGVPRALGFAEKALHLALKANDLEQICRAQLAMMVARADAHGPDGLGSLIAETHGNVMRLGDARVIAWLHIRLAEVEARRGRFDQTERHLDLVSTVDAAPDEEDLLAGVQVSLLRGVAATLALHPERSLMHNREALRRAREAGYHFGEVAALLNMGQLSLNARRLDEARHYLDLAAPLLGDRLPLTIGWTDTRAQLELAEGNLRECQRLVNRLAVLSEINRSPKPSYSSLEATLTRVQLQRRQGDMQGALTLLEEGAREAQARRSPVLEATFDVQRADVLLETGRPSDALQALRDASRHSLGSFITVLAEAERVRARAADAFGLDALARAREARAARIFRAIGQPAADEAIESDATDATDIAADADVVTAADVATTADVAVDAVTTTTANAAAAADSEVREEREPAAESDAARSASAALARESGLLMLESAASLLELGGRRDLLAEEVFDVCQRNIHDGAIALIRRATPDEETEPAEGATLELRHALNWTRPIDSIAETLDDLVRVTIPAPEEEASYELLVESADDAVITPLVDDLQALVDAAARLDAVRTLRLKTSTYARVPAQPGAATEDLARPLDASSSADGRALTAARGRDAERAETERASHGRTSRGIFTSATMLDLLRQAERVGRTDLTVLITGETGVGKEILAEEIRRVSTRDWSRYAKVVCSSASRELLESHLFTSRHERNERDERDQSDGRDESAERNEPDEHDESDEREAHDDHGDPGDPGEHGADAASAPVSDDGVSDDGVSDDGVSDDGESNDGASPVDRGTLLLDEIGELPLDAQLVLLQLIDAKDSHATGASLAPPSGFLGSVSAADLTPLAPRDVRLICVTNANLDQLVLERRFRDDLLHRINIVTLRVPPLRERRDEILPLARHFLSLLSARHQRPEPQLSDEAAEQLQVYGWPGNVRELRNEMERLVSLLDPDVTLVRVEALSDNVRLARPGGPTRSAWERQTWESDRQASDPAASSSSSSSEATALGSPGAAADGEQLTIRADLPLREALEEAEREIIARRIRQSPGNLDRIAAGLGLSRKGLYVKRQRYGLL